MGSGVPNEDITFSLGLTSAGVEAELSRTEAATKGYLDRIAERFRQFKSDVEAASKVNFGLSQDIKAITDQSKTMGTELARVRDNLKDLKKLLTDPMNAKGLRAELKEIISLQQQSTKLTAQLRQNGVTPRAPRVTAPSGGGSGDPSMPGRTLNQGVQQFGGVVRNMSTLLTFMGVGGGIFALVNGFKNLVKEGIDFNAQLEMAKITLGSVVAAASDQVTSNGKVVTGISAIAAAQGDVGKITKELRVDSLFIAGTFEDILKISTALVGPVLRTGQGLEQVRLVTKATALAASVLGVEFTTATTGMLQLLNGKVIQRNDLIKRLPFSAAELNAAIKDPTSRVENLLKLFDKINAGAPMMLTSYKSVAKSIEDITQQMAGRVFEPLQAKIKDAYNDAVKATVDTSPASATGFTAPVEATLQRVTKLVDSLVTHATVRLQDMFGGDVGATVLSGMEKVLPQVIDGFLNLLNTLKSIGEFFVNHASAVMTVLKYYIGFQVVVGVINSVSGSFAFLNKAVTAIWSTLASLTQQFASYAVQTSLAAAESRNMTAAYVAIDDAAKAAGISTTGLTTAWASFAKGGIIAIAIAITAAIVAMGIKIHNTKQEADDFRLALEEINSVKFDRAIDELNKLYTKIKEHPSNDVGWWASLFGDSTTASGNSVKAEQIIAQTAKTMKITAEQAGLGTDKYVPDTGLGERAYNIITGASGRQLELQAKGHNMTTAEAEQLVNINRAIQTAKTMLKELQTAEDMYAAYPQSGLEDYANANGSLWAVKSDNANVTYKSKKEPPPDVSKQQTQLLDKALTALKEFGNDEVREYEKQLAAKTAVWQKEVTERKRTIQEASKAEIDATVEEGRVAILQRMGTFQSMRSLMQKDGAWKNMSALGIPSDFNSFSNLAPTDFSKMVQDLTMKGLGMKDKGQIEKNGETITQVKALQELNAQVAAQKFTTMQKVEKLQGDINNADVRANQLSDGLNTKLEERRATTALEQAQQTDLTRSLDDRVARARHLADLEEAAAKARVDRQAETDRKAVKDNETLTPEERQTAIDAINSTAALQKDADIQKIEKEFLQTKISLREQDLKLAEAALAVEETKLAVLRAQTGGLETPLVIAAQNRITQTKAQLAAKRAENETTAAHESSDLGLNTDAASHRTAAAQAREDEQKALQDVVTDLKQFSSSLENISGVFSQINKAAGDIVGNLGGLFKSIDAFGKSGGIGGVKDNFSKASGDISSALGGGTFGKIGGDIGGALAAAGPIAAIASTAIGLFKGVFSLFNSGIKEMIEKANKQLDADLASLTNNASVQKQSVGEALANMEVLRSSISSRFPVDSGFFSWLTGSMGDEQKAQQDAFDKVDKDITQLKQDAQNAAYTLWHDLLPSLQPSPAYREFADQLQTIRTEIQGYAGNPDVNQSDVNNLFNIRLLDLQHSIESQINDEKKNYVGLLKNEISLQDQLTDIAKQRAQVEEDYTAQRNQILGISTRQLSEAEQLAKLDQQHADQIAALDKQQKDAQDQLDMVEQQKAVYADIYGQVADIHEYEMEAEAETLAATKERLAAMQDYLQQVKDFLNQGIFSMLDSSKIYWNGSGSTAYGPDNPPATNPDNGSDGGSSATYNVYLNGNAAPQAYRDSVVNGLRQLQQDNSLKGLAFGNA